MVGVENVSEGWVEEKCMRWMWVCLSDWVKQREKECVCVCVCVCLRVSLVVGGGGRLGTRVVAGRIVHAMGVGIFK